MEEVDDRLSMKRKLLKEKKKGGNDRPSNKWKLLKRKKKKDRNDCPSKKRKLHKRKKKEDVTSKLPDDILMKIMSKLSVAEVAGASRVSRRWKKLSKEVIALKPSLEFHPSKKLSAMRRRLFSDAFDADDGEIREYLNGVNQVMKVHRAPTLEALTVVWALNDSFSEEINGWMEFAAKKRVKRLTLKFQCVFNKLQLLGDGTNPTFRWMEDLHMDGIIVAESTIESLLSNSPHLQRLRIVRSPTRRLAKLHVAEAPNLKRLEIIRCERLRFLKISAPNLECLHLSENGRLVCVELCAAPKLASLTFFGMDVSPTVLMNASLPPSPLSHACLGLCLLDSFDLFQLLLSQISQVKMLSLFIDPPVFEVIARTIDIAYQFRSELRNLKILNLFMGELRWVDNVSFLWICALLHAAPSLHTLSLEMLDKKEASVNDFDFGNIHERVKKNIRQRHENLKVVKLVGCTGNKNEVELLLNLAEIGISLEKIIIDVCHPWKPTWGRLGSWNICYERNQPHAERSRQWIHRLKNKLRSNIEIVLADAQR